MERFDHKGMMIIPNPVNKVAAMDKVLVVNQLHCPNGHSLISDRTSFNGRPGILIGIGVENRRGLVALSPIYGDKTRVAIDIDLPHGALAKLFCPVCNADFPVYANCSCGGELLAVFLNRDASFKDCIGICNRIDCVNARIVSSGELISETMIERV